MRKFLFNFLFFVVIFLFVPKVSALATDQYYYNESEATYKNNYTVTQVSSQSGWIFDICNNLDGCNQIDVTTLTYKFGTQYSLTGIDGISIIQGGNTNKLYFTIYFYRYNSTNLTYNYSDYYEPRKYFLNMDTYNSRRSIGIINTLKNGMSNPTNYGALNTPYRFIYDFSTNSFTNSNSPIVGFDNIINNNKTNIKINYTDFDIYNTDNGTSSTINSNKFYTNNYVSPIPNIDVSIESNKQVNGAYSINFNFIPVRAGWYVEILELSSNKIINFTIETSLESYTRQIQQIVSNSVYNIKIYDSESKTTLYYQKTFNFIIDEDKPHIVIDSLDFNDDNSYTIYYHFENTTSKNTCYYALYDLDYISHDCSLYNENNHNNFTISHNGLFALKIENNISNDIVDSYLLNMSPNVNDIYISFNHSIDSTTRIYTLKYDVKNYNSSDLLYYSLDNINWIYLDDFTGTIDFVSSNVDVYFKVLNSSGEVKYQTIYNVSYSLSANVSDVANDSFFEGLKYYISNFFDAIMVLWNNIPSEIRTAVIVVLPIILLCIAVEVWRKN